VRLAACCAAGSLHSVLHRNSLISRTPWNPSSRLTPSLVLRQLKLWAAEAEEEARLKAAGTKILKKYSLK
jgi:hypothetical protein